METQWCSDLNEERQSSHTKTVVRSEAMQMSAKNDMAEVDVISIADTGPHHYELACAEAGIKYR